ncbi:MAG: hypothetical protein ACJ73S_03705 [Mycobacteriales bacterium]
MEAAGSGDEAPRDGRAAVAGLVRRRWLRDLAVRVYGPNFQHRLAAHARAADRTTRRWLAGDGRVKDQYLAAIAAAAETDLGRLRALEWDYLRMLKRGVPDLAWDAAGAVTAALRVAGIGGGVAARPASLPDDPAAVVLARLLTAAPLTPPTADQVGLVRLPAGMLDSHAAMLTTMRHQDDLAGGGSWRGPAQGRVESLARLLDQARAAGGPDRVLLGLFARAAQYAGWCEFESGLDQMAWQLWMAALRAADAAGDQLAFVQVLASLAFWAIQSGRPADAIFLCSLARSRLESGPGGEGVSGRRARALLLSRQAVASAALAHTETCWELLDQAQALLADLAAEGGDEDCWTYYVDPSLLGLHAGLALLGLGEAGRAVDRLQDAVAGMPARMVRNRGVGLAWLALARLTASGPASDPAVEQAVAEASEAALLAETQVGSRLLLVALRRADEALEPYRDTVVVKEFRDRFAVLLRCPVTVPGCVRSPVPVSGRPSADRDEL